MRSAKLLLLVEDDLDDAMIVKRHGWASSTSCGR